MSLFDERVEAAAKALRADEGFMAGVHSALEVSWSEYIARLVLVAAQEAAPQAENADCDRDRMGICKRCGMGLDALKVLDGDFDCPEPPSSDVELRKIAENATPGPWESTNGSHILGGRGASVAQVWGVNWRNNQTFIETFNPELIVALLDRVEAAEQALQRVREQHQYEVIGVHEGYGEEIWCPTCKHHYPCPTIRALEGDE